VSVNETEFHYQDKVHPISYVTDTVSSMRVHFLELITYFSSYKSLLSIILNAEFWCISWGDVWWMTISSIEYSNIYYFNGSRICWPAPFLCVSVVSSFFYLKCLRTGLQLFPPEEWLVGASLPSKYVPSRINMILDELSPKRVRYDYTVHGYLDYSCFHTHTIL
jgi:hypothetical protein